MTGTPAPGSPLDLGYLALDMAVDAAGDIFILDRTESKIFEYHSDRTFVGEFDLSIAGWNAAGLAVNAAGDRLYVGNGSDLIFLQVGAATAPEPRGSILFLLVGASLLAVRRRARP